MKSLESGREQHLRGISRTCVAEPSIRFRSYQAEAGVPFLQS
ncbi:hypothetical protein UCMB321_2706 [Pseudomonas batumici]|uniref:Uncharacterized protein n=1 Tax=Pseudomonas batumici TaxID=226910 RepID=A0A0C2I9C5_9PSED|nr:hypothetical protein UCMB321_2706 [Pseudomonas batumici]